MGAASVLFREQPCALGRITKVIVPHIGVSSVSEDGKVLIAPPSSDIGHLVFSVRSEILHWPTCPGGCDVYTDLAECLKLYPRTLQRWHRQVFR